MNELLVLGGLALLTQSWQMTGHSGFMDFYEVMNLVHSTFHGSLSMDMGMEICR